MKSMFNIRFQNNMHISRSRFIQYIFLSLAIIAPYVMMFYIYQWYSNKERDINNARFILISKQDMYLTVFDYKGNAVGKYPIACGLNSGDKEKQGDMKTPEGVFKISEIQESDNWTHDFNDGMGEIKGAYGPYFIRLFVPDFKGIGIHGTHDSTSIGKRITEGCIRLRNEDLIKLVPQVKHGTVVVITGAAEDFAKIN